MIKQNLPELLSMNEYPGRGLAIGLTPDGRKAVIVYFIMGRSENSRNRIFVEDGEGIRTQAFDESKMEDPSLIIYAPVRVLGSKTIVTNGDQTDTIFEGLDSQKTFRLEDGSFNYAISILKSADGRPESDQRFTFSYAPALPGEGHFISTYMGNGNPLPSFEGEPVRIAVEDDLDGFTERIWNGLNPDNRVSLFTRFINLSDGTYESRIVNKNH